MKWKDKISNYRQLGGIETSTIDNGPANGMRIAWVNTGSGLIYKIIIDRAMDIADTFFNGKSLAWISHTGIQPANQNRASDDAWLEAFGGGLLTTCGLTHIGRTEVEEQEKRPLNGSIGIQKAEIISIQQPNHLSGNTEMSITGLIKETTPFGQKLELKRTILSHIGESVIKIHDTVTNVGPSRVPHMILYHCNFGWPLLDSGATLFWKGKTISRGLPGDDAVYHSNNFYRFPAPADPGPDTGEACAFVDAEADNNGFCDCGIINQTSGLTLNIRFKKEQLPWLTNWQHWIKNEYVTGLEPGTNPPIGQLLAKKEGNLIFLEPGDSRNYEIEISVTPSTKFDE